MYYVRQETQLKFWLLEVKEMRVSKDWMIGWAILSKVGIKTTRSSFFGYVPEAKSVLGICLYDIVIIDKQNHRSISLSRVYWE